LDKEITIGIQENGAPELSEKKAHTLLPFPLPSLKDICRKLYPDGGAEGVFAEKDIFM
jgi:hypothetical protein